MSDDDISKVIVKDYVNRIHYGKMVYIVSLD